VPLNDYCALNMYDDHDDLVVMQRVGVGFHAQFRGDAGGANPLKRKQYRIHIYLTTHDTPVPIFTTSMTVFLLSTTATCQH
jgi:hypothetical protein